MDNNDFIKHWMEGKVSSEALKTRKEKGDVFVQEYDELITRSAGMKVPDTITQEEAWQKLSARLTQAPKEETKVIKLNRWIPLSIAASLTFMVIMFFVFNRLTVSTQMAETKTHLLPDGSEVTLNADSKISFNRFGWSGQRKITLEGEAFFQVTKGSSFTVETEQGTVTVLGTSFNVNARPSVFEVSCFTGKVKVNSGNKEVMLTKGLTTKLSAHELTEAQAFNVDQTTWRNGDFYFESKPLGLVMNELKRQFNIEIIYKGDTSRLYSGYFNRKNLKEALDMVFKPMSLNYRQENNKIIVQ